MRPVAKRVLLAVGVLGATILVDQGTKHLATLTLMGQGIRSYLGDTVRLEYAKNPGAFLSLGATLSENTRWILFTVGVGIVLAALLFAALTQASLTFGQRTAYLLMVAGGLSNGFDRVVANGRVTDFMNLGIGRLRTGIFNVADLAIVAGVVLMVFTGRSQPANGPKAPAV